MGILSIAQKISEHLGTHALHSCTININYVANFSRPEMLFNVWYTPYNIFNNILLKQSYKRLFSIISCSDSCTNSKNATIITLQSKHKNINSLLFRK